MEVTRLTVPIRANMPPCSRCNISFVSFEGTRFGLALRLARCKLCKRPGGAFSKQSILRNPARPAERECSAGTFRNQPPEVGASWRQLTMRSLLILVAICFSATAFAQSAPPKVGNKSRAQVKPKEPMGCKLVGTVRGTKLWAGDCVGSELRGSTTPTETQALPEQATRAITPDQKE
jgi:hypothetical protein